MSDANDQRENAFDRIVHNYYQAVERGERIDPQRYIQLHPEFERELRSFFADLEHLGDPHALDPFKLDATRIDSQAVPVVGPGTELTYIGQYRVLDEIARGGMGVVFKARQEKLRRTVALKMILAGTFARDAEVNRFHREARAAATLQHPNIVRVHEIGQHDGHHYFTMDFIEGESLAHRLQDGSLSPNDAAELLEKIAHATHYAHQRGILHRDLKPGNILIDSRGTPHITDFGLAKPLTASDGDSLEDDITRSGQILGTPSYMAPEQAAAKHDLVSVGSDIYSLGAILYACLIGRAPFVAESTMETLRQVIHEDPMPLRLLNPRVPKDLETICLKCLSKEPHRRYGTTEELADDLRRFLDGRPVLARPVSPLSKSVRWARRNPWITATAALMAFIAIASPLFAVRQSRLRSEADRNANLASTAAQRANSSAALAEERKQEAEQNLLLANRNAAAERRARKSADQALSRVKYFLALAHWDNGSVADAVQTLEAIPEADRHLEWQIAFHRFHGSTATLYGHFGAVNAVVFSPDGSQLASGGSNEVLIWDVATQKPIRSIEVMGKVLCLRYAPDGQTLYSSSGNTIHGWDPRTGELRHSFSTDSPTDEILSFDLHPTEPILVLGTHVSNEPGRLSWHSLPDGSELQSVPTNRHGVRRIDYSPDGRCVATCGYFSGLDVWDAESGKSLWRRYREGVDAAFLPDVSSLAMTQTFMGWSLHDPATGEVTRQGPSLSRPTTRGARCLAVDPLRSRVAISYSDGKIGVLRLETEGHSNLQGHRGRVLDLAFSPNGSILASASEDGTIKLWAQSDDDELFGISNDRVEKNTSLVHTFLEHAIVDRARLALHNQEVDVAVGGRGNIIALSGFGTDVEIREATNLRLIQTLDGHPDFVVRIAVSKDEGKLAAACLDKSIHLWDLKTGRRLHAMTGHRDLVTDLEFSPDGNTLFSCGLDQDVRSWDVSNGRERHLMRGHRRPLHAVAFSDTGRVAASVGGDGILSVWDARSGTLENSLAIGGTLRDVEFLPHSSVVVVGGVRNESTSMLQLWDTQSGQKLDDFKAGSRAIHSLAVNEDGTRLLTCDAAGIVKLWDVAQKQELLTYEDSTYVSTVCFRPASPGLIFARTLMRPSSGAFDLPMAIAQLRLVRGIEPELRTDLAVNQLNHSIEQSSRTRDHFLSAALACRKNSYGGAFQLALWIAQADPADPNFPAALKMFHSALKYWRNERAKATKAVLASELEILLPQHVRDVEAGFPLTALDEGSAMPPDPRFESVVVRWYEIENLLKKAREHERQNEYADARTIYRQLINDESLRSEDPFAAIAHIALSTVTLTGLYERLIQLETRAGRPKAAQSVRLELAERIQSELISSNPADWLRLADLWFDSNRLDEAAEAYQHTLEMLDKTNLVPLVGELSPWVTPEDFRLITRLMRSQHFKPAQMEGKSENGALMYRARFESWRDGYYFHWGINEATFQRRSREIAQEGLEMTDHYPFRDASGQALHCAIWEFPYPSVEKSNRIEGEEFRRIAWTGGDVLTQRMTNFPASKWNGDEHLLWINGKPGQQLEFGFRVESEGEFAMSAVFTTAFDYGTVQIFLDDHQLAQSLDLFRPGGISTVSTLNRDLGTVKLAAGKHRFRVVMLECHRDAVDHYGFGLDYVDFRRVSQ